ncbi:outer membrane transport energization protein TonB (TC 2.C.1.1.1) [Solimonas aquatica]|uniref:Outer membrane transport energization protein TonB (TC 2.C.1.1.1) n=1 Tax=Solimonas aquatica TaxID=489703 RepID=A0A1H9CNX3_9GAMM|nr:energy transducer TonB [Solimonas aquatica]SEQ02906.1 outer membrane transport energization protein TonB (TC 2.C.1.1.1) [Solimonas aquatica]
MEFGRREDPKRRLAGIAGVVVFHALLVYGLVNGLARKAIEILPAPIETKILKEVKEDVPPPPPPPPTFETPPPPVIPPPEISIAQPPAPTTAIHATTTPQPAAAPPPAAKTSPVVKAKNCREPEYPAISQRLNETGSVVLQLLVGVDGKVTEAKVETSSGYPRLDEAAKRALSLCKFTPGTEGGQPTPMWAQLKYTFRQQ